MPSGGPNQADTRKGKGKKNPIRSKGPATAHGLKDHSQKELLSVVEKPQSSSTEAKGADKPLSHIGTSTVMAVIDTLDHTKGASGVWRHTASSLGLSSVLRPRPDKPDGLRAISCKIVGTTIRLSKESNPALKRSRARVVSRIVQAIRSNQHRRVHDLVASASHWLNSNEEIFNGRGGMLTKVANKPPVHPKWEPP